MVSDEKKKLRSWFRDPLLRGALGNGLWEILAQTFIILTILHLAGRPYEQTGDRYFFLLLVALVMDAVAFHRYNRNLVQYVEARIAERRYQMMEKVRNTSLTTFEQVGPEKIYTTLTYDVGEISSISREIGHTIRTSVLVFLFFARLAALSWLTCIISVAFLCVLGGVFGYIQLQLVPAISQVREKEKHLFDAVRDILDGFKELRLHDRKSEDFFHACLLTRASDLGRLKSLSSMYFTYSYIIVHVLWLGTMFAFIFLIPRINPSLSGLLMLSVSILIMMPKTFLIREVPRIMKANISMRRLMQLENLMEQLSPEPVGKAEETAFAEIRYENIAFRYEEKKDIPFSVGPATLRIQAGEIVFITGGNGSGKSTLMKLITGLYPIQSGRICLNGKKIRIAEYRWLFSAIFTDYHLFDRLYGIKSVDEAQVDALLHMFQLDGKVHFEEDVFNTHDLSTGQKKRLALLMAMLEDKPIYIFDEWAADQDPQFRRYFYETLLPSFKVQGKTVIAVTHDDRYFHVADRVIKLEYGQIATS